MTSLMCLGTLAFSDYVTDHFFKNEDNESKLPLPSIENGDMAMLIRGGVLAPVFPDGCRIIINDKLDAKDGQWVLLRRDSWFCIGQVALNKEDRKVTLTFPGRDAMVVPFEDVSQLVVIRGILF